MISNYENPMIKHSTMSNGFNRFSFKTPTEYYEFRNDWKENYKEMTIKIRSLRVEMKNSNSNIRAQAQSEKAQMRVFARQEMERLEDAKAEYKRICAMQKEEETVNG